MQLRSSWNRLLVLVACGVLPTRAMAQGATVNGRVIGEAGAPLVGATISIGGMGIGSQTGADGRFSFTVPAARVSGQTVPLNARRVGYIPQTVPITLTAGTITHDFAMITTPLQLEQVIVTGAGTSQVRERIGSTINSVDTGQIVRAAQPQNLLSALSATTPNVRVNTQTGEPGGSAFVLIRGATSVTGLNQPLIIVDNQPIDNQTISTNGGDGSTVAQNRAADINPNDVESVQVLKGSAASAIYGARASNGVILITTKHGANGLDALGRSRRRRRSTTSSRRSRSSSRSVRARTARPVPVRRPIATPTRCRGARRSRRGPRRSITARRSTTPALRATTRSASRAAICARHSICRVA